MSEIDGWLRIIEIIRPTLLQGIDHPRFRGVGKENGGHYNLHNHPESSKRNNPGAAKPAHVGCHHVAYVPVGK
jgi:hypothetical protein